MATPGETGARAAGSLPELPKSRLHWMTSTWPQFFFAALLVAVHLAASFIWSVRRAYIRARKGALGSLPWMTPKNTGYARRLEKLPTHVAFAISEVEPVSLPDVANLIVWAFDAGVSCVSLFDREGEIKSRKLDLLRAFVTAAAEPTTSLNATSVSWIWSTADGPPTRTTALISSYGTPTNGNRARGGSNNAHDENNDPANNNNEGRMTVSLLSMEDGRPDIVQAARAIAERVSTGEITADDISEDSVSGALEANRGLPDPDVLVRVGPSHTNLGFPPWQIRLTEIYQLDSLRGVSWSDLYGVLSKYSKCEQRFGR